MSRGRIAVQSALSLGAYLPPPLPQPLPPPPALSLREVEQTYQGRGGLRRTTLSLGRGERLALVGASGSGKSTLLRLVAGLVKPAHGVIELEGTELTPQTAQELRRRMGYAIQEGGLFPHLTGAENILLPAHHLRWSGPRAASRLEELASLVRLPLELLGRYPRELSGGQRQRVGLARALCLDPGLLLLDEPLGALDSVVRSELQVDLLAILQTTQKTMLLVTHDLAEAAFLASTIAVVEGGALVAQGPLEVLREQRLPIVAALFGAVRTLPNPTSEQR